ncbi:MAG TPA: 30S ribosomal protein S1 [Edaphobacter sp.]|nr:30S ribosomal protein S1 [Edaphobacter sp.]
MSNPNTPESTPTTESNESFDKIFAEYEHAHPRHTGEGNKQIEGTVVAVSADSVFVDIGYKTEGVLPLAPFQATNESVQPGDKLFVSSKGRNPEGYYDLSRIKVAQPKDWSALEQAFADKTTIAGTVTAVVKGGLTVDIGVRAFMPGSRSGARDAADMEKLVGQEIRCRIIKLETEDEDVVVDRRTVLEEEDRSNKERRYAELKEGDIVSGTIRTLADYGAFVDIGGADGLLHISDIGWHRVTKPSDVLTVGQQVETKILKIDPQSRRISLGMKQLLPHPWDAVPDKYKTGERIRGAITRTTDFGAFVELEPGIEGMIHLSEMSWAKKVRKPSDLLKPGETVDAIILGINTTERRIALGLKQALGDPWAEISNKLAVGSVVEGPITNFTKFGAFVQVAEGIEGLIHVSEISAEKRIERPQDVLRLGQQVTVKVLEVDKEKRQLRLSIKQMVPTGLDDFLAEHKQGDTVTGRLVEVSGNTGTVELGEGVLAKCSITAQQTTDQQPSAEAKLDLSDLGSMLKARWKNGPAAETKTEATRAGQIRSFKITKLDQETKTIELQLA